MLRWIAALILNRYGLGVMAGLFVLYQIIEAIVQGIVAILSVIVLGAVALLSALVRKLRRRT